MLALITAATLRAGSFSKGIEADIASVELDWLTQYLCDVHRAVGVQDFEDAWLRLERLAHALGMPDGQEEGVVAWAEDYLRQAGRPVPRAAAFTVGTPEYRKRHISRIWTANLWHEVVMIAGGAVAVGMLFYAIARNVASWM